MPPSPALSNVFTMLLGQQLKKFEEDMTTAYPAADQTRAFFEDRRSSKGMQMSKNEHGRESEWCFENKAKIMGVSKVGEGLKKYLANLTEFIENPRGLLRQCALPCPCAKSVGLNEKNRRGMSLPHTLLYGVYGLKME